MVIITIVGLKHPPSHCPLYIGGDLANIIINTQCYKNVTVEPFAALISQLRRRYDSSKTNYKLKE